MVTTIIYKKILVEGIMHLGDLVASTAIVPYLKKLYPGVLITYLVTPGMESVLGMVAGIDDVIVYAYKSKGDYRNVYRMAHILRSRQFDLFISFDMRKRTAIMSWLAKIPTRVTCDSVFGWRPKKEKIFFNRYVTLQGYHIHEHLTSETFSEVVRRFAHEKEEPEYFLPRLQQFSPDDIVYVKHLIPNDSADKIKIAIAVKTGAAIRNWPVEKFTALINQICAYHNVTIILVGISTDRDVVDVVISGCTHKEKIIDLCGRTTISQLAVLFETIDFLVHFDNGMGHIAAAVECPTITIFSNSSTLVHRPPGNRSSVVSCNLPCVGCCKGEKNCEDWRCLHGIQVEMVMAEVRRRIATVGD